METPSPPSLNLRAVLTETRRIINAHSRHFLALSVVFLLPISFSSTVYPTLHNLLISDHPLITSQKFFTSSDSAPPPLLTNPPPLSLSALGSITYSVFHGFYGRPVKLLSAVNSVRLSFFPLLGTVIACQLIFMLIAVVAGLFLFLFIGVFEMIGLEMELSSPYFVGLFIVVAIITLVVLLYLQVNWTLAGVVSVVEPRWGFGALRRSADLMRGMRGVGLWLMVFFGVCSGVLGLCSSVSYEWRSRDGLRNVVMIVLCSMGVMVVLLYHAAANTVLYMYCKAVNGELALEIAEEFASEYVSLPFDDGKVPHVVSVAYVG
ncbi:PREDICTED: uncharacterized protein LOC101297830 [Fragaria vesca subsp. vesca]|uniref:uncharacterized protein LOC101297830 n=1 Tax=Fragaria vesca subsp. vesca TaxID=101020 RepID=UPI0002C36B6D|nr:PREDICTED: uncharacterized protein LOC101297830 [Fragaria vesca subsp. vesca]